MLADRNKADLKTADRNDDDDVEELLTPRERRLQRIEAYEASHYGQRARTVQREVKQRAESASRPSA